MSTRNSPWTLRLRMLGLALGIGLLLWLPFEDQTERTAIVFAVAICTLAAAHYLILRSNPSRPRWLTTSLTGFLAGLGISPVTLLLMAFKTGLHGHQAPDYTPAQVTSVLLFTPAWAFAGLLVGMGIGIFFAERSRS